MVQPSNLNSRCSSSNSTKVLRLLAIATKLPNPQPVLTQGWILGNPQTSFLMKFPHEVEQRLSSMKFRVSLTCFEAPWSAQLLCICRTWGWDSPNTFLGGWFQSSLRRVFHQRCPVAAGVFEVLPTPPLDTLENLQGVTSKINDLWEHVPLWYQIWMATFASPLRPWLPRRKSPRLPLGRPGPAPPASWSFCGCRPEASLPRYLSANLKKKHWKQVPQTKKTPYLQWPNWPKEHHIFQDAWEIHDQTVPGSWTICPLDLICDEGRINTCGPLVMMLQTDSYLGLKSANVFIGTSHLLVPTFGPRCRRSCPDSLHSGSFAWEMPRIAHGDLQRWKIYQLILKKKNLSIEKWKVTYFSVSWTQRTEESRGTAAVPPSFRPGVRGPTAWPGPSSWAPLVPFVLLAGSCWKKMWVKSSQILEKKMWAKAEMSVLVEGWIWLYGSEAQLVMEKSHVLGSKNIVWCI